MKSTDVSLYLTDTSAVCTNVVAEVTTNRLGALRVFEAEKLKPRHVRSFRHFKVIQEVSRAYCKLELTKGLQRTEWMQMIGYSTLQKFDMESDHTCN